ncbi:MAG: lysostaphin resistance A-like protein [Limisphaerales bacterium]
MSSAKPWRAEAVFFFIAAQAFCVFFGAILNSCLVHARVSGFKNLDGIGPIVVGTLTFQGATWPLMLIFFWMQEISLQDGLGLTKRKLALAPLLAVGALIIVLPAAEELQWASVKLMGKMHWRTHTEEAVKMITNATSMPEQIYLAIFAVALAPVAEEFIFRGVLFRFIKQCGFPKIAWLGVSLLFALIHADAAAFISLFMLALVLTWLYETTGSLLAPMFTHALFNAANLAALKFLPQ